MNGKYAPHVEKSIFYPTEQIKEGPINSMDVNYWVIAKKAAMIFVPVVDQKISKEIFYCSLCKSWLKISNSFKNIRTS